MKQTLLLFYGFLVLSLQAQQPFNCSSHLYFEEQMKNDPEFRKNQEQLEAETQAFINSGGAQRSAAATYIIPMVFHVIHTGGSGNISDAQIADQINILNKEFPRLQADTALTPGPFKSLAAPFSVEFRLATIDPDGNCTNGINRIFSTLSNCSYYNNDVKKLSYWPSNKYLNIWIVQSMNYSSSQPCDGGGYASFPGGNPLFDGINIRGDLISNIGTSATNTSWGNFKGRYLIHELGHWFNLRHIWGDANCGNDLVADTPPHVNSNSGCPSFPHNPNNSCGGGPNGEMFTNYMDYTNGNCLNMFTAGQVARMTAAINSNVSGRNNLWQPANLIATGTSDPYTWPVACGAMPDIVSTGPIVACVGDDITITDNSYGGLSDSRAWDFPDGNPSSVTDSIVTVNYFTSGVYSFGLTKYYLSSSKTATFVNKIHILDGEANGNYVFPFSDSFEDAFGFDVDWVKVDNDNDGTGWELTTNTAYYGSQCVTVKNFGSDAPLTDDLISPAYDLSPVVNPTLTFRVHFATTATNNYDKLQVFISKNCGATWNSIYSKSGTGLRTQTSHLTSDHTPGMQTNEWRLEKINLNPVYTSGIVRFKFAFTSGGGNNIYLDDINIDGISTIGIEERFVNSNVNLFPNPTENNVNIRFHLKDASPAEIWVSDVVGKRVYQQQLEQNGAETTYTLPASQFNPGVYFVTMKQKGVVVYNGKFVKSE